jgi:hypothetical protein
MHKKIIIASLSEIADSLDNSGLYEEANLITNVMTKVAQSNFIKNRFLELHPQLQQEIDRLKSSKQGTGLIDISDIYANNRYWNMPSFIEEKNISQRIKQLQSPEYQRTLAEKRLKFISNKLEAERLPNNDRQKLVEDIKYLKQFLSADSLSENPALRSKNNPETAYDRMQQNEQDNIDAITPKAVDYNQEVYKIVFKKLREKNPKMSDTEIGLSLSNKTNLQGYKDIARDPSLRQEILSDIKNYSSKFIDKDVAYSKLSGIFIDKISFSGVR